MFFSLVEKYFFSTNNTCCTQHKKGEENRFFFQQQILLQEKVRFTSLWSLFNFFLLRTNLFFLSTFILAFFFKSQQINYYQRNLIIKVNKRENQNKFTFRFGLFWRWPCVHQLEDIQAQKISKNFCFLTTTDRPTFAKVQCAKKTKFFSLKRKHAARRLRGKRSYVLSLSRLSFN